MSDDTYRVERQTTIDAPPSRVYEQIVDFHRWTAWSPWEELDPNLERSYSGAEAGTGAKYAWSGNRKAGRGHMTITDTAEPSNVTVDLAFEKPFKSQSTTAFDIQPTGDHGSRVTWSMTGRKTLMVKVMGLFSSMDKLVGRDFEKGLANLKRESEQPLR